MQKLENNVINKKNMFFLRKNVFKKCFKIISNNFNDNVKKRSFFINLMMDSFDS